MTTEPDQTARLHDEILTLRADLAQLRDLLRSENGRANAAIDRETTAEEAAEEQRLALSEALGLGTSAPWDAITERAAELTAGQPATDRAAVARVRALHQQYAFGDDPKDYCAHCNQISGGWIPWPCPTIRALDEEQQPECPTPLTHNWGCGCPGDQLPLHAESGVDTPGCDCGHQGMGPKWHAAACAWLATMTVPHPDEVLRRLAGEAAVPDTTSNEAQDDCCGAEPPRVLVDSAGTEWTPGDCWCTLAPGHDGEHRCEPCIERHGVPGWTDAPVVAVQQPTETPS